MIRAIVISALAMGMTPGRAADDVSAELDPLAGELAICSAYYALLAEVARQSPKSRESAATADAIKANADRMLAQALAVSQILHVPDETILRRVKVAMDRFVTIINAEPAASGAQMATYGRARETLKGEAATRFRELVQP